jgi:putative alpha-1,2-mannosidase
VEPAGGLYVLGSPLVDEATMRVGNGKIFTIRTLNNSPQNKYIKAMKLNGEDYKKFYLAHEDIVKGGILELEMTGE